MNRAHLLLMTGLAVGGCSTPSNDRAEPAAVSEDSLPLVRYYVIGDT